MSIDKINAALLLLKSKAVETYGVMKDCSSKPPEIGDAENLAKIALSLVQFEGAYLTLQQYTKDLLASEATPSEVDAPADTEVPPPREEKSITVTPERSPTYRKSMEQQRSVRKGTKDE
jgi:hypothetical protein